jgi:hypothetical protein
MGKSATERDVNQRICGVAGQVRTAAILGILGEGAALSPCCVVRTIPTSFKIRRACVLTGRNPQPKTRAGSGPSGDGPSG